MEELFRFVSLRSADAVDPTDPALATRVLADSAFRVALIDAPTQSARETIAKSKMAADDFVSNPFDTDHGAALMDLADAMRSYAIDASPSIPDLLQEVVSVLSDADENFSAPSDTSDASRRDAIAAYTQGDGWQDTYNRIADSLLALRETVVQSRNITGLGDALRAAELLRQLSDKSVVSAKPGKVMQSAIFFEAVRDTEAADEPDEDEPADNGMSRPFAKLDLSRALEETLRAPDSFLEFKRTEERFDPEDDNSDPIGRDDEVGSGMTISRVPRLSRQAMDMFSDGTKKAFEALSLDPTEQPLETVVKTIRFAQKTTQTLSSGTGRKLVKGTKLPAKAMTLVSLGTLNAPKYLLPWVPIAKGHVAPAGVGDLHVVRQTLKRYQGGEVAHIENVLQGEKKEREHRRRRYTEFENTTETEVAVSEERVTQTTERFELGLETKRTAETEFGNKSDLKIAGSYGPMLQMEASTAFSYKSAKSESHARSTSMSKEIVDKASTSLAQKIREQQRRKVVEEVEETNRHGINAENADGHVVGVYQWVDKVYEAQVFNYGRRVMYDLMVPEPAAWFIWALSRQAVGVEGGLTTPPPFELSPADIQEATYEGLVALYQAKDVAPPPEPYVMVAWTGSGGPNPEKGPFVGSDTITLPENYEYAGHNEMSRITIKKSDKTYGFNVVVGGGIQMPGQVPVIYDGYSLTGWSAAVHVVCRRTDRAMETWRQDVWNALHDGHRQQVRDYEDKLSALLATEGVEIEGRNPGFNRQLETTELKKSCVALLSGSYPNWIQSVIDTRDGPVPSAAKSQAQGAYVRFFEQAFEWENVSYIFYPYYWARAAKWEALMSMDDVDPQFLQFLTAGFARVVVPVRPGFETVVEHFRQTGKVWLGGKLPTITDPDYLPIADEIAASLGAPGDEVPVGEPWDVIVPTQLVKLRPDNSLPQWAKQPDGSWTEG